MVDLYLCHVAVILKASGETKAYQLVWSTWYAPKSRDWHPKKSSIISHMVLHSEGLEDFLNR